MYTGFKPLLLLAVVFVLGLLPQKQEPQDGFTLNFVSSAYAANKPPPPKIKKPKVKKKAPAKKPSFKKKPQKKKSAQKASSKKSLNPRKAKPQKKPKDSKKSLKPKKKDASNKSAPSQLKPSISRAFNVNSHGGWEKAAPKNGFIGKTKEAFLKPGTKIDRYGHSTGHFSSPMGTKFEKRSLPTGSEKLPYSAYVVKKPFPVTSGKAAPAFGKPGLGTQYQSKKSIDRLVKEGYLVRIKEKKSARKVLN